MGKIILPICIEFFKFSKISVLRKLFAITLLTVHLFNLGGYFLLFHYFIGQSDKQLVLQLDNDQYNDNDLVEIKLPLHLPYVNSQSDYERVDGEIKFDGSYYTFVKRKVSNDTLYLKCLPNTNKKQLYTALTKYGAQANDLPGDKSKAPFAKKSSVIDEYNQPVTWVHLVIISVLLKSRSYCFIDQLSDPFTDESYEPPEPAGC